ncbi:UDP-3-O-(3-hydroxymyristoyl)glucosamine N-acyltransferase [Sessilibacter sp. MAH2]
MLLGDIASAIGAELVGDDSLNIVGIADLERAQPNQLAFVARSAFAKYLPETKAGVVILTQELADQSSFSGNKLICSNPYLAYAQVSQFFDPFSTPEAANIHATAIVAESAVIGSDVIVGANAVIEDGVKIGAGTRIGANSFIGKHTQIGDNCLIHSNVVIYHEIEIGHRVIIHSCAVIGADGFGFAPKPSGWQKIHQLGGVVIGNDVEIGATTAIDRGALGDTVLADGVKLDNHIHIAHNVELGKNTAIAAFCGIAGSTKIGANCTIAGMVGFAGHLTICDNAHFTGKTMVASDISEPGVYSSGIPCMPAQQWRKNAIRISKLDETVRQVRRLEKIISKFSD